MLTVEWSGAEPYKLRGKGDLAIAKLRDFAFNLLHANVGRCTEPIWPILKNKFLETFGCEKIVRLLYINPSELANREEQIP